MTSAAITACSLVTSLGADAATSCAAARAGLVRTQAVEGLGFVSMVDGEAAPVIVHAVPLITRGFVGRARLERLLGATLAGLHRALSGARSRGDRIAFYVSMPSPVRTLTGLELIADERARAAAAEDAQGLEGAGDALDVLDVQAMLDRVAARAGLSDGTAVRFACAQGHAGGARCAEAALADLARREVDVAVVTGVDSLLDEATLEWLHAASRLKLDDMPVGLRPGEAGAALVLVRPDHESAAGAGADLHHVGFADETRSLLSGATSVGIALARVLREAAAPAGWTRPDSAWLICDHNGETYRANEWGHALVRARADVAALDSPFVWLPAESFGDTGAASAIVGTCVALPAFARGYAPVSRAVVASSSEGGLRSALVVGGRETLPGPNGGRRGRS